MTKENTSHKKEPIRWEDAVSRVGKNVHTGDFIFFWYNYQDILNGRSVQRAKFSVPFYLLPFDPCINNIMKHQLAKITQVKVVEPYTLGLRFDDGTKKRVGLEPVLQGLQHKSKYRCEF